MSERASEGFVEWLFRRQALAAARAGASGPSKPDLLRRGALTRELADRTLDAIEPLPSGPAAFLALDLYRVAAYFHLAAAAPGSVAPDLRAAWDASAEELLRFATRGPEGRARIEAVLLGSNVAKDAALPEDEQQRRAEDARDFVHALARKLEGKDGVIERLVAQRALRVVFAIALLAVAVVTGFGLYFRLHRRHDLGAGRSYEVSSTFEDGDFDPIAHTIDRGTVSLLFHTKEEENPWFVLDLGAVHRVGTIEVKNRADCCLDRAVPLIVEVSTDHETFVEVARRTETFLTWNATFEPRDVRWVRLRVPRRTWFHLERVSVYGP